ncbi:MAG TPA: hypothetical protein VNH84_08830 [Candidatus Saccharimonadales bacterium]|nr:hypothetical protein [Candidatus Saccharimonadales bacterium]
MTSLALMARSAAWICLFAAAPQSFAATWAEDALLREAGFIVNCSFTEFAANHSAVQSTDDAYGAINVDRIYTSGPDWVNPGESAMAGIGLLAAARQLKILGHDTTTYEQVLNRFFQTWLLARRQSVNTNAADVNHGGIYSRVYYNSAGQWQSNATCTTAVSGQMLCAMWKYYEYSLARGNAVTASNWLQQSWDTARPIGDFIKRMTNATYKLVRGNASGNDLWVSDSAMAAAALRCLDQWAITAGKTKSYDYGALADTIAAGLQQLKDNGTRKNFFKYRSSGSGYAPTYGDSIDQLCFLPYEADTLDPIDPFCRALSDWWTTGSGGINMTYPTAATNDWRYFGTHWHYYFTARPENDYLYPGPGLQLAKVEWKHAQRTGNAVLLDRAQKRLQWAGGTNYSGLWFGATGVTEAGVPNGLVDWRSSTNYPNLAPSWQRFVDTSAYFIEAVLMIHYGVNTKYIPNSDVAITRQGTNLMVTWKGTGTLQSADQMTGPWRELTNSTSPYAADPAAAAAFYRLRN